MNIKKVMVLLTDATDKVFIYTDMPCPYVIAFLPSQEPLILNFDCTADTGIEYVKKNFNIEPEVVEVRHFKR
jgi:hypothetical protein